MDVMSCSFSFCTVWLQGPEYKTQGTRKTSLYYLFCEPLHKTAEIWIKRELLILSVFVSQPSGMKKAVLWRWWKAWLLLPFPSPSSLPLSQIIKAVKVRFTESLDTWQVEKTEEGSGKSMCSGTVSKQDVVYLGLKLIKLQTTERCGMFILANINITFWQQ